MTGLLPALGLAFLFTTPPGVPGEQVQVLEVEVEVEVFDREGQPVPGLSAADFRVRDEGQVRPIVRFEPWEEAASRERFEEPTASPSGLRRGQHLLLLFDLTYTNPLQLQRARQALKDWVLHAVPPADYLAVAAVSIEQGSRWLAGFSRDRAQTARAIDGVSLDRLAEDRALDPLRLLVVPPSSVELSTVSAASREGLREEIASIGGEVAEIEAELAAREARRYEAQRVELWARAVRGLFERLAVLPVRKRVILVSEGFDARLFQGREEGAHDEAQRDANRSAAGQFWRIDPEERFGSSPVLDALHGLVEAARRGNAVLYSLDPGGLRAFGETQRLGRSRGADSLFYLAQETGGDLLVGLEKGLERVARRTRGSYLLAFRADDVPANGAFRRLKVELSGKKGLKVFHRSGWYAPRPFAELHPFERELLAADRIVRAEDGSRGLSVSLAAPAFYGGKEAAYVPVLVEVPTSFSAARVPEFELFVYALDEREQFQAFLSRRLRWPGALPSHRGWKFYGSFALRPGRYRLRALVRETPSGRSGFATHEVVVPEADEQAPWFSGPFVLEADSRWLLVRDRESEGPGGTVVYPFVAEGEPFVPAVEPVLRAGQRVRATLLVRGPIPAGAQIRWVLEQGDLRLEAVRQVVSVPALEGAQQAIVTELEMPALRPGAARLISEFLVGEAAVVAWQGGLGVRVER